MRKKKSGNLSYVCLRGSGTVGHSKASAANPGAEQFRMIETTAKVTLFVAESEVEIPPGKYATDHLHGLLLVEEEKILILRDGDREVFLDEIEFIEIEGGERLEK